MPTSKQRRDNARRRLERQIQRRQEAAQKRRRRNVVTAAALSVVVVLAGAFLLVTQLGGDDDGDAAASASATPTATATSAAPTPSRAPKKTSGPCVYAESDTTLTNPDVKDVGLPADPKPTPATGTVPVTMKTNLGDVVITLDRSKAPCAVQSWLYLSEKKFFDNTPCPRVSDTASGGLGILQCGAKTVSGGPTYQYKQENTAKASYDKGVVAMANSGQEASTGSQFFILWEAAPGLGKDYSVVGKVTKGLDIIEKVGKAGNDGSNQAGGGAPKTPITIETMRQNK